MSRSIWLQISCSSALSIVLCLVGFASAGHALDANVSKEKAASSQPCRIHEPELDRENDVLALTQYQQWLAQLLHDEKFQDLDCLADSVRDSKARFAGGEWKLHWLYAALHDAQLGQHSTDADWKDHLSRLQRWVDALPNSITARVALAESYTSYAWHARGDGLADTVSDSGWDLFRQRLHMAASILKDAFALDKRCPEWYLAMQQVSLGEGWDNERATELFRKAVAFERGYYYFYRREANRLLPKWEGSEGDASRFAQESADRVGGKEGDALYFRIASQIACPCNEPEFKRFSFPRLQAGFDELEREYGPSMVNLNRFALMAAKDGQPRIASNAISRVGDHWDKEVWKTEDYFVKIKNWSSSTADYAERFQSLSEEVQKNLKTAEGASYQKEVDQRLRTLMQACSSSEPGAQRVMIEVGPEGTMQDMWMPHQTALVSCLFQQLLASSRSGKPFPNPPHPAYWIEFIVGAPNQR